MVAGEPLVAAAAVAAGTVLKARLACTPFGTLVAVPLARMMLGC